MEWYSIPSAIVLPPRYISKRIRTIATTKAAVVNLPRENILDVRIVDTVNHSHIFGTPISNLVVAFVEQFDKDDPPQKLTMEALVE